MSVEVSPPTPRQRATARALVAVLGAAALWRAFLAVEEYLAATRIVDDPSAREFAEASALLECGLAILLLAHAAGAFVYTRRRAVLNWPAIGSVALVSGLCLLGALGGLTGFLHPVLLVVATAVLGWRFPREYLSFYVGGLGGCVVAWLVAGPDRDPFVGLFVVVPSLVWVLLGSVVGSRVSGMVRLSKS